jgi:methyl-accepting chemotaxis protein
MKNGHKINIKDQSEIPPFWGEEWMDNVIEKLKDANLTPDERLNYKVDLVQVALERERYHDEMKKKLKAKKKMEKLAAKVKETTENLKQTKKQVKEAEQQVKQIKQRAKEAEQQAKEAEQQAKEAEQQAKEAEQQAKLAEQQAKHAEEKTMTDTTIAALKNGMTVDQIASVLNYPKGFVLKVKEQLDREN